MNIDVNQLTLVMTGTRGGVCVFLHIPKCAGTSIIRSISDKAPKNIFITSNHGNEPHMSPDGYLSLFGNVPNKAFDKRIIAGHLLFGIHQRAKKLCTYTTIVRHPVDRLLSQYFYMMKLGVQNKKCRGCDVLVNSGMTFENFVSLQELLPLGNLGCLPNLQTFMIAGEQSSDMLCKAKQNIDNHFAVMGIQEQFECFRTRLSRYLGIPIPSQWLLKNDNELSDSALSSGIRRQIEKRDALDMELYDYIKRKL